MLSLLRKKQTAEFDNALVVDSDELSVSVMEKLLAEHGVKNVVVYRDAAQAWEKMQDVAFDLIIFDWKLEGLSGLQFYSRLRQDQYYASVPILVVSKMLNKSDLGILRGFPFTAVLEKPLPRRGFGEMLERLYDEKQWFIENTTVFQEVEYCFQDEAWKQLRKMLRKLLASAPNKIPLLCAYGMAMRDAKQLADAETYFREALDLDRSCVLAITEMGRLLNATNRYSETIRLVRSMDAVTNERMDLILFGGTKRMSDYAPDDAREQIRACMSFTAPNSKHLPKVSLKVMKIFNRRLWDSIPNRYSALNNVNAVALVRSGKMIEGIHAYNNAIMYLIDMADVARVAFNIGFSYLRGSREAEAKYWFQRSADYGGELYTRGRDCLQEMEDQERAKRELADAAAKEAAAKAQEEVEQDGENEVDSSAEGAEATAA